MITKQMSDLCNSARASISAGLDGEATELELRSAERHQATCEQCRAFADAATRTTHRVRNARPLVSTLTFAPPRRRSAARRWVSVGGAAGSLAAMALLGVFVSAQMHQPRHAPPPMKVALLNPGQIRQEKIERHRLATPAGPQMLRGGSLG